MPIPVELYRAIGGAEGCRALSVAFYGRVERDPVLRPLFPSTFTCAIEEFSAFLVQFLGGDADHAQRRWWLSLRESHERFRIGERERNAWLNAMTATLAEDSPIADGGARGELLEFFRHSSAYMVNSEQLPAPALPLSSELGLLWEEQLAIDEVSALIRVPDRSQRCIELLQSPVLQRRFERSPAVHASVLALAATSGIPLLRSYAVEQIRADPALGRERYKGGRTLLHDAAAAGDPDLVQELLEIGGFDNSGQDQGRSPLYCVGNERTAPGAAQIVRALLRRDPAYINTPYGVKECTPLHMAARRGNVEVIGALLEGGADIEARDSAGDTPLRRAVNCNQWEAAKLLLERGADPLSKGSRSLTPASAARTSRMKQLFGR